MSVVDAMEIDAVHAWIQAKVDAGESLDDLKIRRQSAREWLVEHSLQVRLPAIQLDANNLMDVIRGMR